MKERVVGMEVGGDIRTTLRIHPPFHKSESKHRLLKILTFLSPKSPNLKEIQYMSINPQTVGPL